MYVLKMVIASWAAETALNHFQISASFSEHMERRLVLLRFTWEEQLLKTIPISFVVAIATRYSLFLLRCVGGPGNTLYVKFATS